jgi:hypothetical protein
LTLPEAAAVGKAKKSEATSEAEAPPIEGDPTTDPAAPGSILKDSPSAEVEKGEAPEDPGAAFRHPSS